MRYVAAMKRWRPILKSRYRAQERFQNPIDFLRAPNMPHLSLTKLKRKLINNAKVCNVKAIKKGSAKGRA